MALEEFKDYVRNSGVDFDNLTTEEKRMWRETFDKSQIALSTSKFIYYVLIFVVF